MTLILINQWIKTLILKKNAGEDFNSEYVLFNNAIIWVKPKAETKIKDEKSV